MIPFRVIRSAVLLTGLLAALATLAPAADGFTASLSTEQKAETGLDGLAPDELAALDRLVATDVALARQAPGLADAYSQRYTAAETKAAGLDRLTPAQLARLDDFITAALAAAPPPSRTSLQPRERPRLRGESILSERGRLQVHGGMSLTYGWAGGGRNHREASAWVSYFDPVTGLGLSFGYSRSSGDLYGGYYGRDYYRGSPYLSSAARPYYTGFERPGALQPEFDGGSASLNYLTGGRTSGRGYRY